MSDYRLAEERIIDACYLWPIKDEVVTPLSPLASSALASANVVIYDRALARLVAKFLPLGSYAEPWSPDPEASGPPLAPRALKFAAEGWSVAQLVEARPCWRERLRELAVADGISDLPIRLIEGPCIADPLTLIFGPIGIPHPLEDGVFTANGLAG